jgi:cardiolipin synthase (CMP-forming)
MPISAQRITRDQREATPERVASIWTFANGITCFRVLLIAPFLYFIGVGKFGIALGLFLVASITDFADGYFARRLKQESKLGQILDPVADKLLTTSGFVVLAIPHSGFSSLPIWLVAVVVARDVLILVGSLVIYIVTGYSAFKPTLIGKINTLLELGLVLIFLLFNAIGFVTSIVLCLYVVVAASVMVSGLQYLFEGVRILRTRGAGRSFASKDDSFM